MRTQTSEFTFEPRNQVCFLCMLLVVTTQMLRHYNSGSSQNSVTPHLEKASSSPSSIS